MNLKSDMKIYVLVITYKNLSSLQKCLNRLFIQYAFLDKIVVVNNASHDATEAYLEGVKDKVNIVNLKFNTGGAGGYHYGLKYCVEKGADWVWCVEDDILSSRNFARDFKSLLSEKQEAFGRVGFLYPKVISIMNRKKLDGNIFQKLPEEKYSELPVLEKAQFAGCLLNVTTIKKVGLPLREFFIYYDDWEYTSRMIKKGYTGLFLNEFYVWHNADEIRQIKPYLNRRKQDVWKHFYGIRNELYILRKRNLFTFIKPFLMNLIYVPILVLLNRKDDKVYVAFNWFWWTVKSLFFKTEIAYPDGA